MVQRLPTLSIKAFNDCEPGELVQYRWAGNALGIVMDGPNADQRFPLLLKGGVTPMPCFFPSGKQDPKVLSYGKDYILELDLEGPKDFSGRTLGEKNGAIFVTEKSWSVQVCPAKNSGFYSLAHFDLDRFAITDSPSNEFTIFGNWGINIYHPISHEKIPVFKFQ